MEDSTSKEKILKKIRKALINKSPKQYAAVDLESEIFVQPSESLEIAFAEAFTDVSGKFIFCVDSVDFAENINYLMADNNWQEVYCNEPVLQHLLTKSGIKYTSTPDDLLNTTISVTSCEYLVARTGSVLVSSKNSGRKAIIRPPVHMVVAYTSQLVPDIKDALRNIKQKYDNNLPSFISFITGPSRTADIEKTLIIGAHGPKELYVFLIDDIKEA